MEEKELDKIWSGVLNALKLVVSDGSFNTYLKQTALVSMNEVEGRWVGEVKCGSAFTKTTLEQRYWGQLVEELNRISGKKCEIKIIVKSQSTEHKAQEKEMPLFEVKANNDEWRRARLREDFTFDNYAVGGSNQMAYAASQAVARKPGSAYNPLFIYGGVGLGKTHLMQGIGHVLLSRGEGPVLFCSGEEFTNDLVEGIRLKSTERVRAKYRRVKLLMIDDVQFIAGKATVQEEFFHTFNSIQREGGQIVMTSDKPPIEIAKLEERLRSRFGAGMIVDVGPADFELRTAILLIKAKQGEIELPMEVAQAIATYIEGVRELQGFLVRLTTEMEMTHKPATIEMVEKLLKVTKGPSDKGTKASDPDEVINMISSYFGVGVSQIKGDRRTKTIAWPRQILMYLLRNELRLPFEEVGRLIGGRDHTTAMHADTRVQTEAKQNEIFRGQLEEIKKLLISHK